MSGRVQGRGGRRGGRVRADEVQQEEGRTEESVLKLGGVQVSEESSGQQALSGLCLLS